MGAELWIKWFSECGFEGADVNHSVEEALVEGHSASRPVHIHSYSERMSGVEEYKEDQDVEE